MSWTDEFEQELAVRRVRRAVRERLVAELADHIACEPAAEGRLGDPREIAGRYAAELATDGAQRGALRAFAALALTAGALVVSQSALGAVGYPRYSNGVSTALTLPALAVLVFGAQIAFVSGTLAAWRARRRRGEAALPGAEVALLRRRTRVALAAGLAVNVAQGAYVADFADRLPVWWLAMSSGLALFATLALALAWRGELRGAATVTLTGPAGDLYDDLPPLAPLRGHPVRLWALGAIASGAAVTAFTAHAERSLVEGLERGGLEVAGFTLAFVLLSRAVGARR